MDLHEHQAKTLLRRYSLPISDFVIVSSRAEAERILLKKQWNRLVIKAQVHAGGRAKAGGIRIVNTREEALHAIDELIGMRIVNQQTGSAGVLVGSVLLCPPCRIKHEYYLSLVIDRQQARPCLILSKEGGVDIEEVSAQHPEKILTLPLTRDGKLRQYQLRNISRFLSWEGAIARQGADILQKLAKAFIEMDATLLEVNPLVETDDGKLDIVDLKLVIDDNALFRQKEIAKLYDPSQQLPNEVAAKEYDLSYIPLEGNVACMVNGAGLAMATMDMIDALDCHPANFLDIGGGASEEKVSAGMRILLSDPKVCSVLVNIFGGIMNCAVVARGILGAARQLGLRIPLVLRMEGSSAAEGIRILEESELEIIFAKDLQDAAEKVRLTLKGEKGHGHTH